jgi:CRP-like cAMP-binding protein
MESDVSALKSFIDDVRQSSPRQYTELAPIIFQGEIPPAALVVMKGYVVSYSISTAGFEQIVGFYSRGDILPAEWLFNLSPVALYHYRAFTKCELSPIARDVFLEKMKTDHALMTEVLQKFISGFIGATIHIHALEQSYSKEKLARFFHYLVMRYGVPAHGKELYDIPFPLTHAQIASMIGVTRETVAVEAQYLKRKGALSYKKGMYTIDLPKLIAKLGSEAFDTLKM